MQRRLGLFLAVFASGVLVFSGLQPQISVLTLRQAWINVAIGVVVSLLLLWPFPDLVQVFCGIMRFTAPVAALFFVVRGRWGYLPPLLLLGAVFHAFMWVAEEMRAGHGPRAMLDVLRARLGQSRAKPGPKTGDERPPQGGGTFIVRGPDNLPGSDESESSLDAPPRDTSPRDAPPSEKTPSEKTSSGR